MISNSLYASILFTIPFKSFIYRILLLNFEALIFISLFNLNSQKISFNNLSSRQNTFYSPDSIMKSDQALNFFSEIFPGMICMLYLDEKKKHWPVKVQKISEPNPKNQRSLIIEFKPFNVVTVSEKDTSEKIKLDLSKIPGSHLVPFESFSTKKSKIQRTIKSGKYLQKQAKEFEAVMRLATKAFEDQLKTPFMYQMLKRRAKQMIKQRFQPKKIKNQSPNSCSENSSNIFKFSQINNLNNYKNFQNSLGRTETQPNSQKLSNSSSKVNSKIKNSFYIKPKTESRQKQISNKNLPKANKQRLDTPKRGRNRRKFAEDFKKIQNEKNNLNSKISESVKKFEASLKLQQSQNKQQSIKRRHTQIGFEENSVNSLECTKKKRRCGQTGIALKKQDEQTSKSSKVLNIRTLQSAIAPKHSQDDSKKSKIKSQMFKQQDLNCLDDRSSKNSKQQYHSRSRKKEIQNLKAKPNQFPNNKASQKIKEKVYNQIKIDSKKNHTQISKVFKNQTCRAIWEKKEQNYKKEIQKNVKKPNQIKQIKPVKNSNVKIEFDKSSSQNSSVSSRTRSKTFSNRIKVQTKTKNEIFNVSRLFKFQIQAQMRKAKKAIFKHYFQQEKKTKPRFRKNNQKNKQKPQPINIQIDHPKNKKYYKSLNSHKLGLQSLFFIYENLFQNRCFHYPPTNSLNKHKKTTKNILNSRSNNQIKLYASILSEDEAKIIEKQTKCQNLCIKQSQDFKFHNQRNLCQQDGEIQQQIIEANCKQEQKDNRIDQLKQEKFQQINQKRNFPSDNIIDQKDEAIRKIQNCQNLLKKENQIKCEEISESSEDDQKLIQEQTTNQEFLQKNTQKIQRLPLKYKMAPIQSFGDLVSLIKGQSLESKERDQMKQENHQRTQSNRMDLEANKMDLKANNIEKKQTFHNQTILFVVQQQRTKNDKQNRYMQKIIDKNPNLMKTKKMTKKIINESNQQEKNIQTEENIFLWSIRQFLLDTLFNNLKNLNLSVKLDVNFIEDIISYKSSQDKFFKDIFPHLFEKHQSQDYKKRSTFPKVSSVLKSNAQKSKAIHEEFSGRKNKKVTRSNGQDQKLQNQRSCIHNYCKKIPEIDRSMLYNLNNVLEIESFQGQPVGVFKTYRSLIFREAQLMLNHFAINFPSKQDKFLGQPLDKNDFIGNYLSFISQSRQNPERLLQKSCYFQKILIIVGKILNLISDEKTRQAYFKKGNYQLLTLNNKKQDSNLSKSNCLKNDNSSKFLRKNDKIDQDSLVVYKNPVQHPHQKKYEEIKNSYFDIQIQNMDDSSTYSSQPSSTSQRTLFQRNSDDFTSFLSNILPNLNTEKHKKNFRKNQQPFSLQERLKAQNFQTFSLKQYSEERNKIFSFFSSKIINEDNKFSYPTSISVLVKNCQATQIQNEINFGSFNLFDSNRGKQKKAISGQNFSKIQGQKLSQLVSHESSENAAQLKKEILQIFEETERVNISPPNTQIS